MEVGFLSVYFSRNNVHQTTFYVMQTKWWLGFPIMKKKIKETMFIVRYDIKNKCQ
jgi:hypothetical protein